MHGDLKPSHYSIQKDQTNVNSAAVLIINLKFNGRRKEHLIGCVQVNWQWFRSGNEMNSTGLIGLRLRLNEFSPLNVTFINRRWMAGVKSTTDRRKRLNYEAVQGGGGKAAWMESFCK